MMMMLQRLADAGLRRENEYLRQRLAAAESQLKVVRLELELLSDVVERDRQRTVAETAAATRRTARNAQ